MKDLLTSYAESSHHQDASGKWHMPGLPQISVPHLDLYTPGSRERSVVEAYIHDRFAKVHRAEVQHFLPNILSLSCGGKYSAALGFGPASAGKLFAEQYLDAPVEHIISQQLGVSIARNQIVEIGNLVSTWKGSSLLLFIVIGEVMRRLGYHYVMFTGTREVKALLARLRYAPVVLADANPAALPDGGASWGSYYTNQPQVMFGDNRPAMDAARKNPMYRATVAAINSAIEKLCDEFRAAHITRAQEGNHE